MFKKWVGMIASVAMLGAGGAWAHGMNKNAGQGGSGNDTSMQGSTRSMDQSRSGSMGSTMDQSNMGQRSLSNAPSATVGANELTGRVIRADNKMLYIEHMGAVLPLKIESSTRFSDPTLKSVRDIKPGDEIRAAFTVKDQIHNVATSITPSAGTGGSGILQDQNLPSKQGTRGTMDQGNFNQPSSVGQPSGSSDINKGSQTPLNDQGTGVGGSNVGGSPSNPSGNY